MPPVPHPFPHPETVVSIRMKHLIKMSNGGHGSFETFWECATTTLMGSGVGKLALTNEIDSQLGAAWVSIADEDNEWQNTTGVFYNGVNQDDALSTNGVSGGGIGGVLHPEADSLPPSIALVVQRRTGIAGRNNRGRVFIPGVSELCALDGFIAAGHLADCKLVATIMGAPITAGGFTMAARHWDRVNNRLEVVTQCRVFSEFRTRRDRATWRLGTPLV